MQVAEKSEQILDALRNGGGLILSAERQVGKTTALLKYMMETPRCVLVVANTPMESHVRSLWAELYGAHLPRQVGDLVWRVPVLTVRRGNGLDMTDHGIRGMSPDVKILVDEYFDCNYRGPFYAAVATVERGMAVVPFHGGR